MSHIRQTDVTVPQRRRWPRRLLLIVVPLIALLAGLGLYLHGGRYISTDNAYVVAQKILVTPQVSGTVLTVDVKEGQVLKQGDTLFTIDPRPYELALNEAQAALARAETDFAVLKARYEGFAPQIVLAKATATLRQDEFARRSSLLGSKVIAKTDIEQDRINLQTALSALETLEQGQRQALAELGGMPDATRETYAPWLAAKAAVDRARWNLDQTVLRAPMAGIATQVANIQLGRYLDAGAAVFAIVSDSDVWIEANPKETDITWLAPNQPVTITVDAFSSTPLKGHVASISPGTGSQFSLIPAQNASGNWVKVVQRVPVRIALDKDQDLSRLRPGMSAAVDIDTARRRSLASLFEADAKAASR
jgi:membrane fusion protein (multidrug efflux system)